jgi:hypothetical protein
MALTGRRVDLRDKGSEAREDSSPLRTGSSQALSVPGQNQGRYHTICEYNSRFRLPFRMPSLRRTLRTLWERPWRDWGLLCRVAALTVVVRIALSTWPLGRVTRGLRRVALWLPHWSESTPAYRRRAAWAAQAVGRRLLPERPCLTQALVLQYLLLRRGDESARLHIGVAKTDGEFQAHAWVRRNGKVLIGGAASPHKYESFGDLNDKIGSEGTEPASSG